MTRIWAPWRMEFIKALREKKGECVFCVATQKQEDEQQFILFRGQNIFVMLNRYPYTNGHLLIMPYRHVAELKDLSAQEYQEMMSLTSQAVEIMKKELQADGFNCGFNLGRAAGAGIEDHIHMHVVPRWVGDTNFLPVLSKTRALPEYLSETYKRLVDKF
ncbi:MAG: HIT domain-containing protein [Pseudomonadota bacterium]